MDAAVVSEALQQLYNPLSSPRVRRRADSLLQNFQRSPEAAHTALRVLQAPIVESNPSTAALTKAERAFAASTLYFTVAAYVRKCRLEASATWTEEERTQHEAVTKDFGMLCQQVWNVLTGPNGAMEEFSTQTQLGLTIAVILLRFHEQRADSTIVAAVEWLVRNQEHPMKDEMSTNVTNFAILLVLKLIPEEVENKRVKFAKVRRAQCQMMVQQSAGHVIQNVLPSIASAIDATENQNRLRSLLMKTFSSWVEYGNVSPSLILESGLLDRAFRETMMPPCYEDALLTIREVVRACNNVTHVPLMELVMKNFVVLGKHIAECMATSNEMLFCLSGCATAIAECGQAFIMYFVDYTLDLHPGSLVYEFLDTILYFTSLHDLDISKETMDFWIEFRAYISGKNEDRIQQFEAFISRVLNILVERTEFPEDYENFPIAAKDRFASYRNDVRAVFRSLATVNAASEDKFVVDTIHVIFHQYEIAEAGPVPPSWWRRTEVYVHALTAVSKSIREEDTFLIPRLFECLSRKEPTHRALSRTITLFLGVMGHWFARHPKYLELYAFQILSHSFELSEVHETFPFKLRGQEDHVGAVSLKKLTARCGVHFFNQRWLDAMLHLYRTNRTVAGTKEACLVEGSLRLVVEAVAQVVATVSYKDAFPAVDELCGIMFQDLAMRYSVFNAEDEDSVEFLCELFDHLSVLATQVPYQIDQDFQHPILCVLEKRWNILDSIMRVYSGCEEVTERFCAMLIGLFDALRLQSLDFASVIMPNLLEHFARSYDGNFLKVIKSIIACAGDDDATIASLTRVMVIVIESALSKIAATGNVDDNPVLVVSLFDLVSSCGSHRPLILVHSNHFEAILALVLHALKAQNPEVGNAALMFLLEISAWYGEVVRTPPQLLKSKEWEGKVLLHQLIQTLFFEKDVQYLLLVALFNAASGGMPPNLLEKIAEVVRSCWACFGRQRSEELMQRLLADDGFLGAHVAPRTRGEFAVNISKPECVENSRKFKRVLSAFCDHFRKNLNGSNTTASVATS